MTEPRERAPGLRERIIGLLRILRLNRVAARTYYRWFHGFASADKDLPAAIRKCLQRAAQSAALSEGDYLEFGVFKGYSLWQAFQSATDLGIERMRFFGFDSFQGLPELSGPDSSRHAPFYEGQYSWPLSKVVEELDKRKVDWKRCFLIDGFFDRTLTDHTKSKYKIKHASVVLLDCDLYQSAALALTFLTDVFRDKTILIMDDWNAFDRDDSSGERRALAEFLHANPGWAAEPWFDYGLYGRVFVMHRRPLST